MKKLFTLLTKLIVVILVLVAILSLTIWSDTDALVMKQKYANTASKFIADGAGGLVHYRDEGPRSAPVLLLLHGSNSSLHTWQALVEHLTPRYRLISFDQHGHGLTGPNTKGDYSASAKIELALKVLDAAAVERAVWVGNSMGGWVAWRAALAVPERVSALVLIDASGPVIKEKLKPYFGARIAKTGFGKAITPYITPRLFIKKSLEDTYADNSKINPELVDLYWELLRYPGNRKAMIDAINTDREPQVWGTIDSITQPTLILWGKQDHVVPLSYATAFNDSISNSSLIVYPNAGHLPMEELPVKVASDIREWLQKNTTIKPQLQSF